MSAVQWYENRFIESDRIALTVFITGVMEAPVVDTMRICGASNNYMQASGARSNEQYKWYTDSLSTIAIKVSLDEQDQTLYAYMDSNTNYYVSIISRSGDCESKRVHVPIVLKSLPTAPVVIAEPTICGNGSVRFEVAYEPGYTYLWYPCQTDCAYYINRSGGSAELFNESYYESYLYNSGGVTTTTVWVEKISLNNFCAGERIPITATSYVPEAPIVSHEIYQCRKDIKTISAVLPSGQSSEATINWYADKEKVNLLAQGPNFTIPSEMNVRTSVYVVVKDPAYHNCESGILSGEVVIYPKELPPSPSVVITESCGKVTYSIQETISGADYFWYTMDTLSPVYTGLELINYQNSQYFSSAFYVAAVTKEQCISNKTRVEGHPLEIAQAPQIANAERCGYGTLKFKVSGNGKNTRYRWYDYSGDPILGEYTSEYTTRYSYSSTEYGVSYIGDNGCESEIKKVMAVINPGPSIIASNDFVCKGESVVMYGAGGNMYEWSENGIVYSNWAFTHVNPYGTTTYTLTDPMIEGACKSVSITIKVNKSPDCHPLAVGEVSEGNTTIAGSEQKAKVYPNPFTDEFSLDGSFEEATLRILDLTGTERYYFPAGSIDLRSIKPFLLPGQYILEIKTSDKVYREKLIKL